MFFRICLIVAIVFGLAVGGVNFTLVKDKINAVTKERDDEHHVKLETQHKLADTSKKLTATEADLKTTKQTLATTMDDLVKSQADLASQTKRADKLTDDLKKTTTERDDAQSALAAYKATDLDPPQIIAMNAEYKRQKIELDEAHLVNVAQLHRIARLTNELAKYQDPNHQVPLPAALRGKIVVTDPKWNFVVVDFGEEQGALPDGELLVNRSGKLVAKVKISSVQKDRCVANIMPGWELGDVLEGDMVIPAYPAS
jgi:hypothetical protein